MSKPVESLTRSRSPVLGYRYIVPDCSDLVQLLKPDNPEHRILDEILRVTFFQFDEMPPSDDGDGQVRWRQVGDGETLTCTLEERVGQCDSDNEMPPSDDGDAQLCRRRVDDGEKLTCTLEARVGQCYIDDEVVVTECSNAVTVTECDGEESEISDVFHRLNSKLDEMTVATRQMHMEVDVLRRECQTIDDLTTRLLLETRRCLADARAVQFLDDLLHLLRDQLEYITLRTWPFLAANLHDYWGDAKELNLVV